MSALSIQLADQPSVVKLPCEQVRDEQLAAVEFAGEEGLPFEARTVETDCQVEVFW